MSRVNDNEQSAVEAVYSALAKGDSASLRVLLHPYLHWTGTDGVTVRGRTKVIALIDDQATAPEPPAAVQLRDGQIYRWQSR
jgi:hypothetical protein